MFRFGSRAAPGDASRHAADNSGTAVPGEGLVAGLRRRWLFRVEWLQPGQTARYAVPEDTRDRAVGPTVLAMNGMKRLLVKALAYPRGMNRGFLLIVLCLWAFVGAGCASLRPDFEKPSVGITSFRPLASQGFTPRFEIGIRVVNPNAAELSLRGMSYKISLNGYAVVEGAANELPVIPAYGEAEFTVVATVALIEGIRFVNELLRNASGQIAYRLQTKLDVGAMAPAIRLEQTGSFAP